MRDAYTHAAARRAAREGTNTASLDHELDRVRLQGDIRSSTDERTEDVQPTRVRCRGAGDRARGITTGPRTARTRSSRPMQDRRRVFYDDHLGPERPTVSLSRVSRSWAMSAEEGRATGTPCSRARSRNAEAASPSARAAARQVIRSLRTASRTSRTRARSPAPESARAAGTEMVS